jgi:hypothetical protein
MGAEKSCVPVHVDRCRIVLQLVSVAYVSASKEEEEVAVTCLRRLVDIATEELALITGDVGVFGGKCVPLTSSRASNLVFPCQLAKFRIHIQ